MDSFRFDPPDLDEAEVHRILADCYGVVGTVSALRGERSHNSHVATPEGNEYVLRVASASEPDEAIDLPTQALVHLASVAPQIPVARLVAAVDGELVPAIERDGLRHRVRFETFLPGVTFDDDQAITHVGLRRIGALLGEVAAALASFDHAGADGFLAWDVGNRLILDRALIGALPADARALIDRAAPRLEAIAETFDTLPRQIIHNDGHAGNLLRDDADSEVVTGVIDFGDLVRTVRVADLAVAGASLVPHQADPIGALAALTSGYHGAQPLTAAELAAVPDAVLARLALSTLLIQYQLDHAPHLAAAVAPERDWTLTNLGRWLAVDPDVARRAIEEVV